MLKKNKRFQESETDEGNDDLQKGIALSLQDQQKKSPDGISAEEQEVSRALEASLLHSSYMSL